MPPCGSSSRVGRGSWGGRPSGRWSGPGTTSASSPGRERARATLAGLPVEIAVGDLARRDVAEALQGRDALIHAGAAYRYDKAAETLSKANLGLAESALGAALQAGSASST